MVNKLLGGIAVAASLMGCTTTHNNNGGCTDCFYQSGNATPCPLCKELPTIRKTSIDLEKHFLKPPEGLTAPYYLYSIGCGNENCMVAKSLRLGFWKEEDAVAEWNSRVEKQK